MNYRTGRLLALAGALLPLSFSLSCVEIRDKSETQASADSAARAAAKPPAPAASPPRAAPVVGPDSVTRIRGGAFATPEAIAALQSDTAHSTTEPDTAVFNGTALGSPDALKGMLVLPVQSVDPSELHDSYNEQRGGGARMHEGLDIPAARGTPVLSATGGRVLKLFNSKAGGKMVYAADSSERFIIMYAHLDDYASGLAEGQPLKGGQVLGTVGTTGNAPPNLPHLHFAIAQSRDVKQWWKGAPVNPYPLLVP